MGDFRIKQTQNHSKANNMCLIMKWTWVQWIHFSGVCSTWVFLNKLDVFSFGVILLEIVSGKKNREFSHGTHSDNLLALVS